MQIRRAPINEALRRLRVPEGILRSLFALALFAAPAATPAAESLLWQGFQGDEGHTGFSGTTAPTAYQPMWVARPEPPPTRGEATSVVYNGKLIISDLSPPTIAGCRGSTEMAEYAILAYNPADGSQVWRTPTRGKLSGAPHIAGDIAYAVVWDCPAKGNTAESSTLYAIDVRDGHVVWTRVLAGTEAGPPVADDGLVVVPGRKLKSLFAYDALSGEARWQAPLEDDSRLTIEAPAVLGDTVFAVDGRHLYAFDLASGAQRWRVDVDGKGLEWHRFFGSPIVADGLVMVVADSKPPQPAAASTSRFSFEAFDALPEHAQDIYREAFNHAYIAHDGDPRQEEAAHWIAWGAVKRGYEKVGNAWIRRRSV